MMLKVFGFVVLMALPWCIKAQDIIKLDSLQLALKNSSVDTSRVNVLLQISDLYGNSNYLKAIEYATQALDLARELKNPAFVARANMVIATRSLYQGDYKKSSAYFFDALKYYEEVGDTSGRISVSNNLGATYDRLGEFDKALTYYFDAQELLLTRPDSERKTFMLSVLCNNIGNIYQTKAEFQSALTYYERALELSLQVPLNRTQGQAYNNLGKLYLVDLKDPVKALAYLGKGLEVRRKMGDNGEIARSLVILSQYYYDQRQFVTALDYAREALALGKETGSLDVQKNAYSCISDNEEALKNYPAALQAFKDFKALSDSIQVEDANSEMTRLQMQYDFEKAEKAREIEVQQTRQRYIYTIVSLSAALMMAVLITLVVRAKAKQTELKRKNLAQDVEIKNKELTTNVMYLIRKNELINNVAERLLEFETKINPENQRAIHDIILDLQREVDSDTWREFELRFNQVHKEFYSKLRSLYPNLSPAEEKLCAFLRLNMSSKEIAAISQQSIKSVEVARARLRKKLNLTNTHSNLVTYLASL